METQTGRRPGTPRAPDGHGVPGYEGEAWCEAYDACDDHGEDAEYRVAQDAADAVDEYGNEYGDEYGNEYGDEDLEAYGTRRPPPQNTPSLSEDVTPEGAGDNDDTVLMFVLAFGMALALTLSIGLWATLF